MQDNANQHDPDGSPDNLPISHEGPRGQVVALARDRLPSLDLRGGEPERDGDEVNLLDYWRIIVKRRWTVLSTLGIVFVTVLVGTLLMTPIYRATTTVQIERDTIKVVDVEGVTPSESPNDRDFYQTQYELIQSRSLAQRVIANLNLGEDPVFRKMLAPSPWRRLLGGGREPSEAADERQLQLQETARQARLVNAFLSRLSIEPVRNSRLVRVHFDSIDPAFSAKVVNQVAAAYITANLDRRFEASAYAKEYLEDRLKTLKLKLEESEKELVAFAQKERIVETREGSSLAAENVGQLNAALGKAQEQRVIAEAKWKQAQAASGLGLPEVLGSSLIQRLQEQRAKLLAEYQDKLSVYKPDFPSMLQLKAQIDETDRQIAIEVGNIKASIQAQYLAAQAQESLLRGQIDALKTEALDLQNRSIRYNILRREVDTNRQQYEALLQRYKDIGIAGGVGTNNISVVDRAEIPTTQHSPWLALNLTLGLLLGCIGGVLLAFLFEHLDDTLKAPEDLEKLLGMPVLGIIPKLKPPTTPTQAIEDPRSAFAEAYRSVRTALQFSTGSGVPRCLLVTSSTPSEGKSTTALTLAKNFAQLGKRVLLVDCDLRNPSLHRVMGIENSQGLSNYLAGAAKATEVIQPTSTPGLMMMPTGPLPPNPAELLMGPKMVSLLTVAAEKFDQLILDGPPVMGLADAPILANIANGTLLVVEAGETRIVVAKNALKRLLSARAHVIGALLTKFEAKHAGYGYGYGYGYGDYSYYQYGGKDAKKLARQ